jgi:hypothetical protein
MIKIFSQEIILHTAAGRKTNPLPRPVVSLPRTGGVTPASLADGSKEGLSQDVNLIIREMGDLPKLVNLPAAFHQVDHDKPSTSTTLATDNNAVGRKQQKPSLSTSQLLKNVILIVAAHYNQFLGGLTPWVASSIPLFSRILAAAAFVTSAVNHKKDNRYANIGRTGGNIVLPPATPIL